MLSLYGKNNPLDHIPSFCGPPLATTSYPPQLAEPRERSPAPIACPLCALPACAHASCARVCVQWCSSPSPSFLWVVSHRDPLGENWTHAISC